MKGSIVGMAIFLALFLWGCQEIREDAKNPLSEKDLYKTIGEEIPFETGMEWIDNFKKKNAYTEGRTEILSTYNVSAPEMKEVLESVTELVGVAFHYGTDALGKKHIVVIPVGESMKLWSPIDQRIFVDANTGTEISRGTASSWTQRYKDAHPSDVWFHFFGKNIFDDMAALPYFNSVDIEPGINTLNLSPQLLLVIWNEELNLLGRTQYTFGTVYDASNACPPCATE